MLPKLNKVLPIKLWYLDPMHQCTDITNYPEHSSLFPNSLIMLISALKCLISVWGETSKIACRFPDYWYLASSKQNRILLQIILNGKFCFFMSVNLNNWIGDSNWGYSKLKGSFYLERIQRTLEDWVHICPTPGHLLIQLSNFRNLNFVSFSSGVRYWRRMRNANKQVIRATWKN